MTDRKESFLPAQGMSETAASMHNRLYGDSGEMSYRVTVKNGDALSFVDVTASTGDGAAEAALRIHPGVKVTHIEPTPQSALAA